MECNLAILDVKATYKAFLKANTTILSMCNVIMFLEYDLYILPFNKAIMKSCMLDPSLSYIDNWRFYLKHNL